MDSNKIKNLAFGARDALRAEVTARIDAVLEPGSPERLDQPEKVSRLEAAIDDKDMDTVVESTAYTWFNRLCALRFMDAKGYTPVSVVTPRPGATQPAILADAAEGIFDPDFGFSRLVRDRVQSVLAGGSGSSANRTEAAYSELLVAVCDHYAEAMPYLFGEAAASSLVMPQGLLAEDSILSRICEEMDDEECETVEVLGWLYQFYVAERKAEFNASGDKATADDIAPATQLFTPDWIVKYLVENSLGRLWMLNNPGSALADKMDYYIAPEGETEDFIKVYSPEELTLCDPACGSGHILVYAFDLLFEIYQEEGYFPEDIPALILQNNLFGMEIDGRAAEIAKFALEMKAREKDPAFFEKKIDANVTVLEPVKFEPGALAGAGPLAGATELLDAFEHMTEVGSLYVPAPGDMAAVDTAIANFSEDDLLSADMLKKLCTMRKVLEALSRTFDCLAANPPYMLKKNVGRYLSDYMNAIYPDVSNDMCTCFIERALMMSKCGGLFSLITMDSWLALDSYESFRKNLIKANRTISYLHLGNNAFPSIGGAVVSVVAAVFSKNSNRVPIATINALDGDSFEKRSKVSASIKDNTIRYVLPEELLAIPTFPFTASILTKQARQVFSGSNSLGDVCEVKQGLKTGDNSVFLRLWFEVRSGKISFNAGTKWYPCTKGGPFRKWYGNNDYVIDWEDDGFKLKHFINPKTGRLKSRPQNLRYMFKRGLTYTNVSDVLSVRYCPEGFAFDAAGSMLFSNSTNLRYLLGLLSSSVINTYAKVFSPKMTFEVGQLNKLPVKIEHEVEVDSHVENCVELSKIDWDSFETSWDFEWHPLASSACERAEQLSYGMNSDARSASVSLISEQFERWSAECDKRFSQLKTNEEELNRIFARMYGMEGEVPIEVPNDKVSVRRADLVRDVKSLISYGVGCIMGRYSTFAPGLILADAQQTVDDFKAKVPNAGFLPDDDAIIPVLDGEWFGDDIVAQFRKWLEVTYGVETLDENVKFIEDALGKDLRKYFVKDFYKDHCATYQVTGSGKRPIYWMFASPQGSFQALVYMHRYTPSTVGQILTKYLREYIEKINAKISQLDQSERAADNRQADKYRTVVRELTDWERNVIYPLANKREDIDLDDGVKVNYNKFPHALARVTGLSTWK